MQVNSLTARLTDLTTGLVRGLKLLERNELACCGVPMSQSMVLQALAANHEPLRMSRIADALGVAQSTATRFVEPLVDQGKVVREPSPDDGRSVVIRLTPKGAALAAELASGSMRCSEGILEKIPQAKQEEVIEAVEIVVAAISDCCAECCSR